MAVRIEKSLGAALGRELRFKINGKIASFTVKIKTPLRALFIDLVISYVLGEYKQLKLDSKRRSRENKTETLFFWCRLIFQNEN